MRLTVTAFALAVLLLPQLVVVPLLLGVDGTWRQDRLIPSVIFWMITLPRLVPHDKGLVELVAQRRYASFLVPDPQAQPIDVRSVIHCRQHRCRRC